MKTVSRISLLVPAMALAATVAFGQVGAPAKTPKAKVSLVPDVEAVSPGEPFEIGLRFELAEGWHIYWKNSGDSGQPPRVDWTLPGGFEAGDLQFPVPKRHVTGGAIVTNIIEGAPILPVRITPPQMIDESKVAFSAKVRYLICQKTCLLETAELKLEIPVAAAGDVVKPANEMLFRRARKALPTTTSKYLSVSASTKPETVSAGKSFELVIDATIKRGFHIQSHTPSNPAFIACEVYLEPSDGVIFDEAVYPPGKKRKVKYLGEVSEYGGKITIRVPGSLEADGDSGPRRLAGILKYQACNEKGTCFPPTAVAFATGEIGRTKVGASGSTAPAFAGAAEPTGSQPPDRATDVGTAATEGEEDLESWLRGLGLPGLLLGCFLYGLFINATPCVLPLLSIKVLGFVQQAHESRSRTMMLGFSFGTGVMILFIALGFLAAQGTNLLQYPAAVIALGAVVMALALSMLGVYTLQVPTAATKLDATLQKEGIVTSFGKGALAPVLGFACVGPFMAGMFGWAAQQPPRTAFLAFLSAGIGMASPYVLLGANPRWLSFLPKPGNWMITFERIMGFLLLGMVILLIHPVVGHLGAEGLEWTLVFLVAVALACWILGQVNFSMSSTARLRYRGGAAALVIGAATAIFGWVYPIGEAVANNESAAGISGGHAQGWKYWKYWSPDSDAADLDAAVVIKDLAWKKDIPWQTWSNAAVAEAVGAGKCAFVDFTAAYCTNCKANKAAATNTPEASEKMKALDVIPFEGDYTSGNEEIHELLQQYERPGVPLNLIYAPGQPGNPVVLRPLFGSKAYLLDKLDEVCAAPVADSRVSRSTP